MRGRCHRLACACVCLWLAACLQSEVVVCGDVICPAGTACSPAGDGCVLLEQLSACDHVADGATCSYSGVPDGVCRDGVCIAAGCGDGVLGDLEECDDTLLRETDCFDIGFYEHGALTCAADCRYDLSACSRTCGDGVLDADHEDCDGNDLAGVTDCTDLGFYEPGTVGCNTLCRFDVNACEGRCGDEIINGGELCEPAVPQPPPGSCLDFAFDAGELGCSQECSADTSGCQFVGFHGIGGPGLVVALAGPPDELYALGGTRTVKRYDGTTWTALPDPTTTLGSGIAPLGALWWNGADDLYAGGTGALLHYTAGSWTIVSSFGGGTVRSLSGTGSSDLWMADGALWHWNGTATTPVSTGGGAVWAVSAVSPTEVFAVGGSAASHLDASGWTTKDLSPRDLRSVWGSPGHAIAVGSSGTIVAWNGAWRDVATGSLADLTMVHGTAPDRIYAIGPTTVLRYDGARWASLVHSITAPATLMVRPEGPVFIGGATGVHESMRGDAFAETGPAAPVAALRAVDGEGIRNVAVGDHGTILIVSALSPTWKLVTSPNTASDLTGVYYGLTSVFAVGHDGTIVRGSVNGGAWTAMLSGSVGSIFDDVFGSSSTDVYAHLQSCCLLHYDGTAWTQMNGFPTFAYQEGYAASPTDVRVVGGYGEVYHYDGAWTQEDLGTTAPVTSIDGVGATEIYASTIDTIYHHDGTSWSLYGSTGLAPITQISAMSPDPQSLADDFWVFQPGGAWHVSGWGFSLPGSNGLAAVAHSDALVVGDGLSISRVLPGAAANPEIGIPGDVEILGLWGASGTEVWASASGGGYLYVFDGSIWSRLVVGSSFFTNEPIIPRYKPDPSVATGLLFTPVACGDYIVRRGTTSMDPITLPTSACYTDIWGSGAADIYLVGSAGTVLHSVDGGLGWTPVDVGTSADLRAVWGSGPNDVTIVGSGSTIRHFDGTSWTAISPPVAGDFSSIWGSAPDRVFVGGAAGLILAFDGTAWSATDTAGIDGTVTAIDGTGPTDVFAVTDQDQLLHFGGQRWTPVRTPSPARTLAVIGNSVFVGAMGRIDRLVRDTAW